MEISGIRLDVTIGSHEIYRAPRWYFNSERKYAVQRAGITLPDPDRELWKSIHAGDAVEISLGYRDTTPATWHGTVAYRGQGKTRDQMEIMAVDRAMLLDATKITQAWENETPEAIVRWSVRKTGVVDRPHRCRGYGAARFVASKRPVWQVAAQAERSCSEAFGLDMRGGPCGWEPTRQLGGFDEPVDVPVMPRVRISSVIRPAVVPRHGPGSRRFSFRI
jgi:hypothetical protein